MNQLKLYRQAMVGKTIIGLGKSMIVFETGEWWALATPFDGNRLEYVGRQIKSIRVIDGLLELMIDKNHKVYLNWKDEHGITTGPQFPVPGKIRCWDRTSEDDFWQYLDTYLDIAEQFYAGGLTDADIERLGKTLSR